MDTNTFNDKVIKRFGEFGLGRWLLSDGRQTFGYYQDHREIGCYCEPWWKAITRHGAVSIHYSDTRREPLELSIRKTEGRLTYEQETAIRDIFEMHEIGEVYITVYKKDFSIKEEVHFDRYEERAALMYLTDPVQYRMLGEE